MYKAYERNKLIKDVRFNKEIVKNFYFEHSVFIYLLNKCLRFL